MSKNFDVIIIGGGQSGLAAAYYLRRTGLSYCILDKENKPGGSWQHYWHSLRLFSPAKWSSLPGVIMSGGDKYYPERDETISYLRNYEKKYNFPVHRPVQVRSVTKNNGLFTIETNKDIYHSKAVISATGSFDKPFIPSIKGTNNYKGNLLHSSEYVAPEPFKNQRIAIVGEGNSGAQILAELSQVAKTFWFTSKPPQFLPDHVDGRYLFDVATQRYEAKKAGEDFKPPSLGDVVMVPSVKNARKRGHLDYYPPIKFTTEHEVIDSNGMHYAIDSIIFCTGFKPALDHLKNLNIVHNNRILTSNTKAQEIEGLWLIGYGSWTGFASATLIGVGRTARATVTEVEKYVKN